MRSFRWIVTHSCGVGVPEKTQSRRDAGATEATGGILRRISGLNYLNKGVYGWLAFEC